MMQETIVIVVLLLSGAQCIMASKYLKAAVGQPEIMELLQSKVFLLVGALDGAFIIASGIGLWFALAIPIHSSDPAWSLG